MVDESDTMLSLPVAGSLTYREWHAFVEGVFCGVVDRRDPDDYSQELHYWRVGFLVGRRLR